MMEETVPGKNEIELTLLGPGYGESIVLHVGNNNWVVVDSCIDKDGKPAGARYLRSIGVNPVQAVKLIVATHWHDDHIRGMAQLVDICRGAKFCCAAALCKKEFLATVAALEGRHLSAAGSGVRELYGVFSQFKDKAQGPTFALANRLVFSQGASKIWSLSPGDEDFTSFLTSISGLVPSEGQAKTRVSSLSPNKVAVALWVRVGNVRMLLGADLEAHGWRLILQSTERPAGKASVFKVPHHGSKNAHEPEVWQSLLDPDPIAVLTPWRLGGRSLPSELDVQRILSDTSNAYTTTRTNPTRPKRRERMVDRTVRESGVALRQVAMSPGAVRLRRSLSSGEPWSVKTFAPACHLTDYRGHGR